MSAYGSFALNVAVAVPAVIAAVTVIAIAVRWERREHARIRAYRKRLAYRDARVTQDIAWRHHLERARGFEAEVAVRSFGDILDVPLVQHDRGDAMLAAATGMRIVKGGA